MSTDMSMGLDVTIRGNADSVVAAAEQGGNAIKGFEGVSDTAIASLSRAIEKLDIDFSEFAKAVEAGDVKVKNFGKHAGETIPLLEDMNRAGGAGARMFSALGVEAGAAAERIEAFSGVIGEMKALAPELIAIGVAIGAIGAAFTFVKDGVQDAAALQQSMDQLRAVVDEQKGSWSAASDEIKKFIENESMASGISETELAAAFANLAGRIHDVHDAMVIMRVAEEEHIATGLSLEEVTNALLEAEAGRGATLAQLDPRLKNLIHDHADMHTILRVLHDDNVKAMEDQNNANMAWARAKIALESMGESIGAALLPALQYLGETLIGLIQVVEDFAKAIGTGVHGAAFLFVDSTMAMVHGVSALGDALNWLHDLVAGDHKGAVADFGKMAAQGKAAFASLKADGKDLYDATVGWMPAMGKGLYDLFHMHANGVAEVDEAIKRHNAAMNDFTLDNNPETGFARGGKHGGHGGHARAGKTNPADFPAGSGSSVVLYDDSIKQTTRDQQKFTDALYASGDALEKQILGMDKSIEANQEKNADERATYGMSLQQQIAYYQQRLANQEQYDATNYALHAQLVNKIDDLQTQAWKKQYDDAKKAHDDQIKLIDDWATKGVALFNTFFEKGKNGFKSFSDAFKKMLDDMVTALEKSALVELLGKILGVNVGSFGSVFGQESGLSSLSVFGQGGAASPATTALSLGAAIAGAGGGSGSGGMASAGTLASMLGFGGGAASYAGSATAADMASAGTLASITSGGAAAGGGGVASSAPFASLLKGGIGWGSHLGGATLANVGLGAVGGAIIGQTVFGGKGYSDVGGAIGGALGTAFLAAIPGIGIPLAILTAFGGAYAGSLFGNHFNPADEPDIYQAGQWGQFMSDAQGHQTHSGPNGANKAYSPDSWTNQLTHNKGWNIVMENFVAQFRGKRSSLPQSLQAVFSNIEALWGGATGQADFNHDGKDGYLDIGSGKRAKWTEFLANIQQFGPQVAQLMDNYESANVYDASNGSATFSGTYTPSGSPWAQHDFPDYGGGGMAPTTGGGSSGGSGGGGSAPVHTPPLGGGGAGSGGGGIGPGGGKGGRVTMAELGGTPVTVVVQGNVIAENQLIGAVNTGIAVKSRTNVARRMTMVGKG